MQYYRTIDKRGYVTIPKPIRDFLNLKPGQKIDFIVERNKRRIVLKPNKK